MPRFDFIGNRRTWFIVSIVVLVVAIGGFFLRGLNLGIDFTGGITYNLTFDRPVSVAQVRTVLSEQHISDALVQLVGTEVGQTSKTVLIETPSLHESARYSLQNALQQKVGKYSITGLNKVTGTFSGELVRAGILAVLIASLAIVLYMMIRFDLRFALTGIAAIFYDALVTLGLVALIHFQISQNIVVAVLIIIGYSLNDRIIIFDRIRENMRLRKRGESLAELTNRSLNQTLARSIITAVVVIAAMLALLLFGGTSTEDLSAAILIGVTFGAYSSILFASPLWYIWVDSVERATQTAKRSPAKAGR
ncbi:MAG: protein translocase subunit SecF [Thermaerobacter sp.]|nr:protein translocase subunit SecF [Thermaerobacter sp.]